MMGQYNVCPMEEVLTKIVESMRAGEAVTPQVVDRILRQESRTLPDPSRRLSKRRLMAWYMRQREEHGPALMRLGLTAQEDEALIHLLRAKPRRTASGVTTLTVLTEPWPCAHDCRYCPNDVRMPKSYLSDEPACQRAERCFFDPYLQVAARLRVLKEMGHHTDKVELIVLGGTWADYPERYRLWFIEQLFCALDDFGTEALACEEGRRRARYRAARETVLEDGRTVADALEERCDQLQAQVDEGSLTYGEAWGSLKGLRQLSSPEGREASWEGLEEAQRRNEWARSRCVGLVVETRPDAVSAQACVEMRRMGVTKVQIGIQSLEDRVLALNGRPEQVGDTERALRLLRLFGFKSHVHMMANLKGSTPKDDRLSYETLMEDARFKPDEVKLYPCALVESAPLTEDLAEGSWAPYGEGDLIELLARCVCATPPWTRISRMIRDIPSPDILTGCKKTNLRQLVEAEVLRGGSAVSEMRIREVATAQVDVGVLHQEELSYATVNTEERFLQWVDEKGRLAAFLRLSFPDQGELRRLLQEQPSLPLEEKRAMIREVHVYGRASRIGQSGEEGNQHQGLGRALIKRAFELAADAGFDTVSVISAVGTRRYYRGLGFADDGLYQTASVAAFR